MNVVPTSVGSRDSDHVYVGIHPPTLWSDSARSRQANLAFSTIHRAYCYCFCSFTINS